MRRFFQRPLGSPASLAGADLKLLRAFAGLGAAVVLAFHIANRIVRPESIDPLAARLVLTGGFLLALSLSYGGQRLRNLFGPLLWTVALLYCLWMVWLASVNGFGQEWLTSLLMLVVACGVSLPLARHQALFSVAVVAVLSGAVVLAEPGLEARILALGQLALFAVFTLFVARLRDERFNRVERLSLVARQTHAAVLLLDAKGHPEWLNNDARELLGQWPEALRDPEGAADLPEREEERLRLFRGRLALAQPFREEVRLTGRDGQLRWLDLDVTPVSRPGRRGPVTGYVVVGRDVTDQKEAEKELRRSEGRYRRLVERSPMPIIALQGERVLYANRAAARLLRVSAPSLLSGRNFLNQVVEEERREAKAWLDEAVESSGGSREMALDRLDGGGRVEVLAQASSVVFTGQEVLQLVLGDLTERKQVERAKDEFVSTVNHELRTPLTSLRGSLGLLDAGLFEQGGEKARMLVGLALRNTERLTLLINDLLDMQKIEAGKADFRMEVVDLAELVKAAVESNQLFADRFDVTFRLVHTLPEAKVYADPNRLAQVLSNLLSNAAKFSPQGTSVDVFVERKDSSIRVTVMDHGPGVPVSFREHLFRKFSRSEPARTNQVPGTGLGLAISRAIIEQHGGRIDLDDAYQDGASFYFWLPELEPDLPARRETRPSALS